MSGPDQVVAIDVGGTLMKGAIVDATGAVRHSERRPTRRESGVDAVVQAIGDFAESLASGGAAAVGLAVPGIVDEEHGVAVYSANIGWRDLQISSTLSKRLGLPIALGHDVRAGGLAEALMGAGRGAHDFLFLPIGTGIAGAMILDGRPYRGAHAVGGEIGHIPVVPHGEPCACGQRGCLETYASASAIVRRYVAAGGDAVEGADEVLARVDGDARAKQVWSEALDALGTALATYVLLLDPALVVVGGGLGEAGSMLLDPLRADLATRLAFHEAPPLASAALGAQAGCLGAAILAWGAAGVGPSAFGGA